MSDSQHLSQAATHDTSLYDPDMHDNQIVAMYETDERARAAKQALISQNVPESAIQIVSRGTDAGTLGGVNAEDDNSGVWGAIRSMFVPDDDRTTYSHAVGRGHAMLVVTPTSGMDRHAIIHALEGSDPVDFDAKLEEWRQAGYDHSTPHADYAAATASPGGMMGTGTMGAPMETSTTPDMPMDTTTRDVATPASAPAPTGTAMSGTAPAGADTIKRMQEQLRVGKREAAGGAVRIRSYVVERPVEEQVKLHEERVVVDRHPVDRAAEPGEMDAFQERTIEARGRSEEAVVDKDVRVVEEIGLHKESSDRTETVRDTVRETKVEVEDEADKMPKR